VRSTFLLLLLAFLLPLHAGEFEVRPTPDWVEPFAPETALTVSKQHVRWGLYDLLSDHQVRGGDDGETQYFRVVRRVLSPSGVQNASELELDFDPSFQRLIIHHVDILRGADRIDSLEPERVRVIEKEDESDNRIYDGERTALLFIKDVRPGDVIDYAWSLEGANPILGGRYTDSYTLSSTVPTRRIRHRLLWPLGRPLQWRGADPTITVLSEFQEQALVWERHDVAALDVEDSIPSWYEPWESVAVTEFASWAEVAAWAEAMFRLDARSQDEVRQLAAKISAEHPTRDARITAAIRFVQDQVRYLGIEMGRNSHQPHQPWETLESRWGDCKDKTLLLVALLRELGLEAWPALVNTRLQQRLSEKLPSPFLFDHVIAQVVDRGRTYWIDGTIAEQGGTLSTIETPSDRVALVVHAETNALTPVITNTKGAIVVEQKYTTTAYDQPTLLSMRTTYSGADADAMRSELAGLSLDDFTHERINHLAIDQPRIEAGGAPAIADDRLRNVIVVTERYRIPDLWKDGHWSWYPRVLGAHLRRPETMIRTMPLAFTHPLDVRQSVTFDFPEALEVRESTAVTEAAAFRYESSIDSNGRTVSIRQSLRSRADFVDAKDVAEHLTRLSAVWSEIGFRLAPKQLETATPDYSNWIVGSIITACFIGICWMLATRRRPAAPAEATSFGFRPGEAPASALPVARAGDIDEHLSGLPCDCGGRRLSSPEFQRARYAERDLTIVTRHCGACGREQSVYFTAA
jgi:transglutaminase-like putative cysteine protease